MLVRLSLLIFSLIGQSVWAESATQLPQDAEQAATQRAQAESLRAETEKRFLEEQNACYGKFLVSSCLIDAKKARTQALLEVRRLQQGVNEFERERRRQEVEAKVAARATELSGRDAEQQEQGERYREEEARKAAIRERKLAEKEQQAEEGRRKFEAQQAAQRQKQAGRTQKEADRAAKEAAATLDP